MIKLAKKALKGSKISREKINEQFRHSEYRFLQFLANYTLCSYKDVEEINSRFIEFSHDLDCTVQYFSKEQELARRRYNHMASFLTQVFTEYFVKMPEIKEDAILLKEELVEELYKNFCNILLEQFKEFDFQDCYFEELITLKYGFNFVDFVPYDANNITKVAKTLNIPRSRAVSFDNQLILFLRNSPKLKLFEDFLKFKYNGMYLYTSLIENPDLKCSELLEKISFKDGLVKEYFNRLISNYTKFFSVPISFLTVGDVIHDFGITNYQSSNSHITIDKFFEKIGGKENVYRYFSAKEYKLIFKELFNKGILYINEEYTNCCISDMNIKSDKFSKLLKNENIYRISEILDLRDFFLDPYNSKNSMVGYIELLSILKDSGILCLKQFYDA